MSSCSVSSREVDPCFSTVLAGVADALTTGVAPDIDTVLGPGLAAVVPSVPGTRWASITRRRDAEAAFTTPVATGEPAQQVDTVQYALGHGPCLQATAGEAVVAGRAAFAARWPDLAARVFDETPVRAVLSHPLPGLPGLASVNFYSDDSDAFTDAEPALAAAALAASICAVGVAGLATRARADNLEQALTSSRQIGAAVGIVMAQQRCTYDTALSMIRLASQRSHRKIRDLAEDIMLTGALPDQ